MLLLLACAMHLLEYGPSCKQSDPSCCCCQDPSRGCAQHPPTDLAPKKRATRKLGDAECDRATPIEAKQTSVGETPRFIRWLDGKLYKNAIEMALLAKYGRVAPGVDVPKTQQVKHGQDQTVVKAGESAHNETMDWDVAQRKQNMQQHNIMRPRGDLCSTLRPGTWRRPLRGGHYCSIDLE